MPTSEARIQANRTNSLRSSGPKTVEGKERSRRNGLKHGMTGRGVVVPEADAAEVERRDSALRAEMDPKSAIGAILIRQMATLSVRMERGAVQEMASTASRVLHAAEAFDEERIEQAAQLMARIGEDPKGCVRRLRKSPEGVDLLVEGWRKLRAALTRPEGPGWSESYQARAANLAGLEAEGLRGGRVEALSRAVLGDFSKLTEQEGGGLEYQARRAWAAAPLVEWIDGQIAGLEADRESLDFEAIERDRAGAGDRALFDPSKEASLARRYEAEARRGFFRSLTEFRRAEAEEAERAESAPETPAGRPEPEEARDSLASCWDGPPPGPVEPPMTPARASSPAVPRGFDVARGLDGRVLAVGRLSSVPG